MNGADFGLTMKLIWARGEIAERDRIIQMAHDQLKVLSERIKDAHRAICAKVNGKQGKVRRCRLTVTER